jgi:hypothetical protein
MRLRNIKHNPYEIFQKSTTPPGLYARQKWLNQGKTKSFKTDFDATVAQLKSATVDSADPSEHILGMLHRLFGLHLTERDLNPFIENALSDIITEYSADSHQIEVLLVPDQLRGLPFAATRWKFFILPAMLFLSAIFRKATAMEVNRLYLQLATDLVESAAYKKEPAAMHNALRALVVHPDDRFQSAIRSVLSWFADRQTPRGDWGPKIPYFQAVNALAHLNIPEANAQFDNALNRIVRTQNTDGTWGSIDQEWQTFLVIHALRNKGIL